MASVLTKVEEDLHERGLTAIRSALQAVGHPDLSVGLAQLGVLLAHLIQAGAVAFRPHGSSPLAPSMDAATAGSSADLTIKWAAAGHSLGTIEAYGPRRSTGFQEYDRWILQVAAEITAVAWLRQHSAVSMAGGDRLSGREEEVAALVARGLTNAGIADHLSISSTTVATHVAHILEKLRFRSRAQVAAWYAQHGKTVLPD